MRFLIFILGTVLALFLLSVVVTSIVDVPVTQQQVTKDIPLPANTGEAAQ